MRVDRLFPPIMIILALGAFLLLFGLDNRPFWQDEAETAGLAKNVLKYGVPRAYDGVNIISQEQGKEYDQDYLWRWSPWLQIYVTAAAFKIGGLTTYAGRFPFALMGIACILLVYKFVRRNFGDPAWAYLAALLLTTSVIFLLFARQCRYYSLGTLLTLINLYAFRENWQTKTAPALLLVISATLIFYTNYLLFFSYFVPFILAAFLLYYSEIPLARALKIILGVCITMIPGLLLFHIQQQAMMMSLWSFVKDNLENYFGRLFSIYVPLADRRVLGMEMEPEPVPPHWPFTRSHRTVHPVFIPDYSWQHPCLDPCSPKRTALFGALVSIVCHHPGVGHLSGLALPKICRRPLGLFVAGHQLALCCADGLARADQPGALQ